MSENIGGFKVQYRIAIRIYACKLTNFPAIRYIELFRETDLPSIRSVYSPKRLLSDGGSFGSFGATFRLSGGW